MPCAHSQGEVDGPALLDLGSEEIRDELGLTLGKRKTLERAIAELKDPREESPAPAPAPAPAVSGCTAKRKDRLAVSPEPQPQAAATDDSTTATAAYVCKGCGQQRHRGAFTKPNGGRAARADARRASPWLRHPH